MIKILSSVFLILAVTVSAQAKSKWSKGQDEYYNKIWCAANHGKRQVIKTVDGHRNKADCVTATNAVEVDSILDAQDATLQAKRYGRVFNRQAKVVLVVEEPKLNVLVAEATRFAAEQNVEIEIFDNTKATKKEMLVADPDPVVKKSLSGICHVKGVGSYASTETFDSYNSIKACVKSGGRLAKNAGLKKLLAAEKEAIEAWNISKRIKNAKKSKKLTLN